MALQIFNHHAAISAEKGAPVDWLRLSPATVNPALLGLPKNAPHPNAGLLFVEFMTVEGGPADFPEGELPAGAPRRAAADARPHPGERRLRRHRDHAGDHREGE